MKECSMYDLNLSRLLDACPFIQDTNLYNGLYEYCKELDIDLNCINFDDLVVNGIVFLDKDEYEELTEEQKEDFYTIAEAENGYWLL